MDALQTRFLVTRHSFEVFIPAEKIFIRLDSMTKCSVFSNLIPFLCGKRNVNRLGIFLSFPFCAFWNISPQIYQLYVRLVGTTEELSIPV